MHHFVTKPLIYAVVLFAVVLVSSCGTGSGYAGASADAGPDAGPAPAICGGQSCTDGQMCHEDRCVAECENVDNLCGKTSEFCCTDEEACVFDTCVTPGAPCEHTEDCDIDEVCDPTLMRCIPSSVMPVCEYVPPPGVFSPEVACQWRPAVDDPFSAHDDVVMTPSVANLTDDNGDGVTDRNDIPDIVFVSFDRQTDGCCTPKGVIRVVSGACNPDGTMTTLATLGLADPWIDNSSGIALGNLHPAGFVAERAPEIVATVRGGGTIAYKREAADGSSWSVMWHNEDYPGPQHAQAGAQPSLADLDADGAPEVIIGNVVLDGHNGTLRWDGQTTVGAGSGVGNNAFLGPASTIADIDLDGFPEVIAGNTVYRGIDGSEVWTYQYNGANSTCGGKLTCDGFNGVGNFDGDPEAEIVAVRLGEVFIINHDGVALARIPIPVDDCAKNESGPPTIADFDGDGMAEIGTASADFYVVVDLECAQFPLPAKCDSPGILWKVANHDCSSRVTGSSVFDFDGDGNAEVVYADETNFRVLDGRTGAIVMDDDTHQSNTRMEMPVVVDVDNDGKSEVVLPEPNTSSSERGGIEIWQDADNNWVRTRRIWNQHTYHITNIDEDGQVPAQEETNWLHPRLNNFRQNVQPDGLFYAPDFTAAVTLDSCVSGNQGLARIAVGNNGALAVPAGIEVFARASDAGGDVIASAVLATTEQLVPGGVEVLDFVIPNATAAMTVEVWVDSDDVGDSQYNECDEDNNATTASIGCTVVD